MCNLQATTTIPGFLSVSYPSSHTFTAPYRDADLSKDEIDYIALRFTVQDLTLADQIVPLTFKWADCKNSKEFSKTYDATLPIVKNSGPAFIQETTSVGPIPSDSAAWVNISYKGMSPGLTNFELKITDPAGAIVSYPADGTSTKLAQQSTLNVLTTDSVAFRIDTTGMKAGTYTMKTLVSYGVLKTTVSGILTLNVS